MIMIFFFLLFHTFKTFETFDFGALSFLTRCENQEPPTFTHDNKLLKITKQKRLE